MKKNEKLLDIFGEIDDRHIPDTVKKKKKANISRLAPIVGGLAAAAAITIFTVNVVNAGNSLPIDDRRPNVTTDQPDVTSAPDNVVVTDTPVQDSDEEREVTVERTRKSTVVADIKANSMLGSSALADTSFTIRSKSDISADEMKTKLSVSPQSDFTVIRRSECEYLLTANAKFDKGSVVKLSVESDEGGTGDCYAFQIADDFRITQVYPADGSASVSTDTGVEIEFSESVDMESAKEHFSIKPQISGTFTTHGDRLYFIPQEKMKQNTKYTVTVSEGIKAVSGAVLESGREFSFTTSTNSYFYTYDGISETFIEGDPAVIEVIGANKLYVDLKLYQYNSSDDYMNDLSAYSDSEEVSVGGSNMTEVFSSTEKTMSSSDFGPSFVMLPYDLKEGYYVASLTCSGINCLYFIEINPISVYSASFGDKTLFFINDTQTGAAAAGAEVTLHTGEKDFSAKVKADGTAEIVTGSNCYRSDILEINHNGHRYIDSVTNYSFYKPTTRDKYFTYIYSDRNAYQTTDVINVWGVIKPRRSDAEIPSELYIRFGQYIFDAETTDVLSDSTAERIIPNADGTFTASITIKDYVSPYSGGSLYLTDAATKSIFASKSVRVLDYVKPTYTFDTEAPEYLVLPQENPYNVTVSASYFDGTPAPDLKFVTDDRIVSGSTITDKNGMLNLTLQADDNAYWWPTTHWNTIRLEGIENVYQSELLCIPSFFRDVMLESEYDTDAGTFTVKTNRINFDKIPEYLKYESSPDEFSIISLNDKYDILRGEAYDTEVTVSIRRSWHEAVETDTYYDFIEKVTRKKYEYMYYTEDIGTFRINTVNGVGTISGLPLNKEGSFDINISYKDSAGRETLSWEYIYNRDSWRFQNTDYRLFDLVTESKFTEGELLEFRLREMYDTGNGDPEGKVFFIAHQTDVLDAIVYPDTEFTYKAEDKCVPNFTFCGAYFDGRHVYPIEPREANYDESERELTLEVSSDKEKYDAGDEVTLTVYARDRNGRPVSGATVCLSVVDEAAFAVENQYTDILGSLYRHVSYGTAHQVCSYIQHVMNGLPGTEKGGGGPEGGVRKDFRDNPYFGEVKTDNNGKAVIKFRLADTITTWRATVQSVGMVNNRLCAGDILFPIVATRPVFISPIMLSEYIAGDDISVTAKCIGLRDDDLISVTLSGDNTDKTIGIRPCASANFGKLPVGEYKVTFRADNGENSDAMELPLKVVETKHEVWIEKDLSPEELSSVAPTKWPVSVTFYDKEYLLCKEIQYKLIRQYSSRADINIARQFALNELGILDEDYSTEVFNATRSGLAQLMPNSEEDLKTTALLCAAFPDSVAREAVTAALEDKIREGCNYRDLAQCYMALAAMGKPVLGDIKNLLASDADMPESSRLYLTAGLALGGDFSAAYESYAMLTENMKFYEKNDRIYAYLENEVYTRLALICASAMNLPEADAIARGLTYYDPKYDSYSLELVVFIRNYVPKTSGDAAFSYMRNGVRTTVKLDRYGMRSILFDREQFESADFRTESGSVLTMVRYMGRINEQPEAPTLNVTKKYGFNTVSPGDIVTVTISSSPHSVIEDVIPSGARLYDVPNGTGYTSVGQHITLYTGISGTATYRICAATSGEYTAEGAYSHNCVYNEDTKQMEFLWGISSAGKFTVRNMDEEV